MLEYTAPELHATPSERLMKIVLITPVPAQSRQGNRVTALRWARLLKGLGHRVTLAQQYNDKPYDLMIALHARRSFAAIDRFHSLYPEQPLIVALTGTDLYGDIRTSQEAQHALEVASYLILLQPKGIEELPPHLRAKARVIYQRSHVPPRHGPKSKRRLMSVCWAICARSKTPFGRPWQLGCCQPRRAYGLCTWRKRSVTTWSRGHRPKWPQIPAITGWENCRAGARCRSWRAVICWCCPPCRKEGQT
jgi:hypothetical protein